MLSLSRQSREDILNVRHAKMQVLRRSQSSLRRDGGNAETRQGQGLLRQTFEDDAVQSATARCMNRELVEERY